MTTAVSLKLRTVEVRCFSKACAKREGDQPKLLFKATEGSIGTIFLVCPRCGAWNPIELAKVTSLNNLC